jgi:hypothetical protein
MDWGLSIVCLYRLGVLLIPNLQLSGIKVGRSHADVGRVRWHKTHTHSTYVIIIITNFRLSAGPDRRVIIVD